MAKRRLQRKRNENNEICFQLVIDKKEILIPVRIYKLAISKGMSREDIVRKIKDNNYKVNYSLLRR